MAERVTAMGCAIAHSAERAFAGMSDHILNEIAMPQSVTTLPASGSVVVAKNDQDRSIKSLSRGRPRSEESEEAISAATLQLLSEKPLRDISMEEIARKARVGKATIYKSWPSKVYVALDAFSRVYRRNVSGRSKRKPGY